MIRLTLFVAWLLVGPSPTESGGRAAALRIEAMIDRGALDQARTALDDHDFSPAIQATLRGRLALARGATAEATRHFEAAVQHAPDHPPLRRLLAHAQVQAGEHRAALATLSSAGIEPHDPAVAQLRAIAYRQLGEPGQAYAALVAAAQTNPADVPLRRALVRLCAAEGMFEAARDWAAQLSPAELGKPLAVAVMQHARGQVGGRRLARWLAAGFRNDADVQAELGFVESSAGNDDAAARAFEWAADLGAPTAFDAAEHYRAARRYREALAVNARVLEDARRGQQRFDILFESGRLARAIATGESLDRAGHLDPRRRYTLAYAHYTLRQFAAGTRHARVLKGTTEHAQANTLLRAMGR